MTGRMGKAVTREEIKMRTTMPPYDRDSYARTVMIPIGTDCMVNQHIRTIKDDVGASSRATEVDIKLTVDFEQREIRVPIEQISFV